MVVLFITNHLVRSSSFRQPALPYRRIRCFPSQVIECHSAAAVLEWSPYADAVLIAAGGGELLYWKDILFLNDMDVFVCLFHCDPWSAGVRVGSLKVDMVVSACKERFWRGFPMFWSPSCIDVQSYDVPRDIDVLIWGNCNRNYPFRSFVHRELTQGCMRDPVPVDLGLTMYQLLLGSKEYQAAVLRARDASYYSPKLYQLVSRARICCTGSHSAHIPVGKFFENAACGVVTVTNDFTDRDALGFRHGENIWITDEEHFLEDVQYLLENDDVVLKMSESARELIRTRHTPVIRAQELYEFFREKTGKE